MANIADPTLTGQVADSLQNKAMMAYYNAKLKGDSDTLAFQKASDAMKQSGDIANAYGFSSGYYTDLNQLAANAPGKGSPTQSAMQSLGYLASIPGYTGTGAGQTMDQLSQLNSLAQGQAGMTGFYYQPRQSQWTPGTFLRIDPNTYDYGTYGDQLDYVTASGQLQRVNTQQAAAMGWNGNLGTLNTVPYSTAAQLEAAPPTGIPQQTLDSMNQYSNLNTAAINQAAAQAGQTGMYYAPQTISPPGTNWGGGKFSDLPADTQYAYYYSNGGDWSAAMNKWVNDSNQAIQQAGGGPPAAAQGQETLSAQDQYFQQAQALASMYGQYYAPGAPGQAGVAGTNMPQAGQQTMAQNEQNYTQWLRSQQEALAEWTAQQTASQNYLTLLSNLRGPADWAKYQQVLGATPGGMKDLVAAAAGQYIPGGGATTGQQPQAADLNSLYNQATGQNTSGQQQLQAAQNTLVAPNQMAPQTWNALAPSQQQMLLGVWESQGYSKDDAQALFNQSLPKYATSMPSGGSFKLQ